MRILFFLCGAGLMLVVWFCWFFWWRAWRWNRYFRTELQRRLVGKGERRD